MNLNYETNLYLPGSFTYYVISQGGGGFPNDYASVIVVWPDDTRPDDTRPRRSPIPSGGLEIKLKLNFQA